MLKINIQYWVWNAYFKLSGKILLESKQQYNKVKHNTVNSDCVNPIKLSGWWFSSKKNTNNDCPEVVWKKGNNQDYIADRTKKIYHAIADTCACPQSSNEGFCYNKYLILINNACYNLYHF